MALGVFSDPEIDDRICESLLFPQYLAAFRRRQASHRAALEIWMADYTAEEKTPLIWLQHQKRIFESKMQENPQDSTTALKLQLVEEKIAKQEYSLENTPEFDYALAKRARRQQFSTYWPDSNETALREEEEGNLLSQLS